jgi:hypothetical protein
LGEIIEGVIREGMGERRGGEERTPFITFLNPRLFTCFSLHYLPPVLLIKNILVSMP